MQVERPGLDLVYPRLLLTQANRSAYPPPRLPEEYDRAFNVLPFEGAEPLGPRWLLSERRYWSKYAQGSQAGAPALRAFTVGGDRPKAMRAATPTGAPGNLLVTAYADNDERLVLRTWRLGSSAFLPVAFARGGRFDEVEIAAVPPIAGASY